MNSLEKNTYVKEQMTMALIELLKEKNISEISVCELTKRAGVGRVSFYRNFKSIEDILAKHANYLMTEWLEEFQSDSANKKYNILGNLFMHYKKHSDFYTMLYQTGITEPILDAVMKKTAYSDEVDNKAAYSKVFFAYGMYGWILEWIKRGMLESEEEINALMVEGIFSYYNIAKANIPCDSIYQE